MAERRNHFEVWTDAVDENLQGISSDPYSSPTALGLRVPFLATPSVTKRYLFMLAGFNIPENVSARICGIRQFASIGVKLTPDTGPVVVEQEIIQPEFRLPDGNISWHLRFFPETIPDRFRIGTTSLGAEPNPQNFVKTFSTYPALIYQDVTLSGISDYYVNLVDYTPPNRGRPFGEPVGHLGTFHDLRFKWRSDHAWDSVDIPVEGPGFFAFLASVRQSKGFFPFAPTTLDISPEQNFISQFGITAPSETSTGVLIWRVAGALRVEIQEMPPTDQPKYDQVRVQGKQSA